MAYDTVRRQVIIEVAKAWLEFFPAEARAFATQLKFNFDNQNKGGAWGQTKAGYKKYTLPQDLWQTLLEVFHDKGIRPLFGETDADIRVLAQEFPDFIAKMNIDTNPRAAPDHRPRQLIVPGK